MLRPGGFFRRTMRRVALPPMEAEPVSSPRCSGIGRGTVTRCSGIRDGDSFVLRGDGVHGQAPTRRRGGTEEQDYSHRSATSGSTRDALSAAHSTHERTQCADNRNRRAANVEIGGRHGRSSRAVITCVDAILQPASPNVIPPSVIAIPDVSPSPSPDVGCAEAIWTPISCVRRATAYATTP